MAFEMFAIIGIFAAAVIFWIKTADNSISTHYFINDWIGNRILSHLQAIKLNHSMQKNGYFISISQHPFLFQVS